MIKKFTIMMVATLFFLVFGMMSSASAISIVDINPGTEEGYFEDGTLQPQKSSIEDAFGVTLGDLLYKANVENDPPGVDEEEGSLVGSYTTSYTLDPEILKITWTTDTTFISGDPIWLFVKDGVHGNYLFNLSNLSDVNVGSEVVASYSWDGMDTLRLSGFWPEEGDAISHISIWGEYTQVPEPGMVILLGIGLIGLAFFSRRRLLN